MRSLHFPAVLILALCILLVSRGARAGDPRYVPLPPPKPPPGVTAPIPDDATREDAELAPRGTPLPSDASTPQRSAPKLPPAPPATKPAAAKSPPTNGDAPPRLEATRLDMPRRDLPPAPPAHDVLVAPLVGVATNGLNVGVGARAGTHVLAPSVYIGGAFMYHFGQSIAENVGSVTAVASVTFLYAGPELGYELDLHPLVARAYLGMGIGVTTASGGANGVSVSGSSTEFAFWPGASLVYETFGDRVFFGGDTRLTSVPGGFAFGAFALAGARL